MTTQATPLLARLPADSITHTPVPDTMRVMAAQRIETAIREARATGDYTPFAEQIHALRTGDHPATLNIRRAFAITAPDEQFHMLPEDAWPLLTAQAKNDWLARAIALLRDETPEPQPEPEPQHQEVEMHHTTDPYLAARALDNILHSADGPTPDAIAQLATVGDADVARITRRALQRVAPDHLATLAPSNIADHLTPSERAQWVQDAIDLARTMPIYPTEEDSDMPLDPTEPRDVATAIAAGRNAAEMELQHRQMLGKHLEVFAHLAEQDILNPGAEIDGLQAACVIAGSLLDLIEAEQHLYASCQATVDAASAAAEE